MRRAFGVLSTLPSAIIRAKRWDIVSVEADRRLVARCRVTGPSAGPRVWIRATGSRPLAPTAMNHVWAYDFVFDTCADGRSLKCLTVVDEFTLVDVQAWATSASTTT